MASKVVLITGANTGIGFEIVRALCSSDQTYDILVGGRSLSKAQDAVSAAEKEFPSTHSKLSAIQIDIEHDDSIQKAVDEVQSRFGKIDALVNNAGAQFDPEVPKGKMAERDMWNQSWNVNVTGTHIATSRFAPLLLASSDPRLLFVASGTASLENSANPVIPANKVPPKGWPKEGISLAAYRSAKTGMNMMMREWVRMLTEDGVKVWAISPGLLATGLGGHGAELLKQIGAGDPAVAGPFFRSVLEGKRDDDAGKVITREGVQPW